MKNKFITNKERSDKYFSKKSSLDNEISDVEMECYLTSTSEYGSLIESLFWVERLAKDIILSKEKSYETKTRRYVDRYGYEDDKKEFIITPTGNNVLSLFGGKIVRLRDTFCRHSLTPYAEHFIKHLEDMILLDDNKWKKFQWIGCIYSVEGNEGVFGEIDEFLDGLRGKAQSKEFEKKLNSLNRSVKENHKSLLSYIDALFKRYSRLLVLRVDLNYSEGNGIEDEPKKFKKYGQVKKDFEHFLNNMRSNTLFDHMRGYVWKLEYGRLSGYHYHVIFLFAGSKVREDVNIVMMIGEYWNKTITKGRGRYYNCNDKKEFYTRCGIGMINHYDTNIIENLRMLAGYLTKADYCFRVIVPKKGKAFGKGGMPKPKSNRGRPRKVKADRKEKPSFDAANLPL